MRPLGFASKIHKTSALIHEPCNDNLNFNGFQVCLSTMKMFRFSFYIQQQLKLKKIGSRKFYQKIDSQETVTTVYDKVYVL